MALESNGDYVGLPTFNQKGLTALVTGANGISGQHMLRVLARHPDRWTKIYALSRRPSQGLFKAPNIEHVSLDLLSGVDNIKKTLEENNITKVDHVFYLAYKETTGSEGSLWGGHEQRVEDNGKMLEDFIHAMEGISFERIVLQTGAKVFRPLLEKRRTLTFTALRRSRWSCAETQPRRRPAGLDDPQLLLHVCFQA